MFVRCSGLRRELTGDAEEVVLPLGDARPAIVSRHFPDRTHEFLWRNWGAVELDKLAAILRTSQSDVTALAVSMGLPADVSIAPEMRQRGYVTLIRRNWHLLPYEQLLELLEITPQQLDIMLREEDFLWVKLGSVKPSCEVLRYQPPDDASQQRAAEIRRVVEQEFGNTVGQLGEPASTSYGNSASRSRNRYRPAKRTRARGRRHRFIPCALFTLMSPCTAIL